MRLCLKKIFYTFLNIYKSKHMKNYSKGQKLKKVAETERQRKRDKTNF